jgi:DNA-binding transcriptional MerR regulator
MKFFTTKLTAKITGVTLRQLQYWDETDLVTPSVVRPLECAGRIRIYNFPNLVEIRTITKLRKDGMSIQKIRRSLGYLKFRYSDIDKPLAQMTLVTNGDSIFVLAENVMIDTLRNGQSVSWVVFKDIIQGLEGRLLELRPFGREVNFETGTREVYNMS